MFCCVSWVTAKTGPSPGLVQAQHFLRSQPFLRAQHLGPEVMLGPESGGPRVGPLMARPGPVFAVTYWKWVLSLPVTDSHYGQPTSLSHRFLLNKWCIQKQGSLPHEKLSVVFYWLGKLLVRTMQCMLPSCAWEKWLKIFGENYRIRQFINFTWQNNSQA